MGTTIIVVVLPMIILGLMMASLIAFAIHGLRCLILCRQAKGWPTTEGTIDSLEINEYPAGPVSDDGPSYGVKVAYSFDVGGRRIRGNRIAFGYSTSGRRRTQEKLAEKIRPGETMTVHYDPRNPSRSVLFPESTCYALSQFVGGLTWLPLIGCLAYLYWKLTHP